METEEFICMVKSSRKCYVRNFGRLFNLSDEYFDAMRFYGFLLWGGINYKFALSRIFCYDLGEGMIFFALIHCLVNELEYLCFL